MKISQTYIDDEFETQRKGINSIERAADEWEKRKESSHSWWNWLISRLPNLTWLKKLFVPPMAESHPEAPGTGLRGLVPPSHFVLRPPGPSTRTLEAELEAEKRRGQALEAELEAERRRGQALEVELEAERRRGQALEAELEAERRRGQALEAELEAERRRGQALEAELEAEKRRGQALEAELEAERRRGQAQGAEPDGEQPLEECQAQVLLQARLSALGHILTLQEHELSRELPPTGVPMAVTPPRLQALLGRWRQKVFALLVQLRVQEEAQRVLRAQVGALGAAVAAGTRRVTRLELSLRERAATAELQRRDTKRLAQEVTRQRGRAEAAEEALGGLARAAARLAGVVTTREAEVTAATRTMVTLSARLRRAGRQLRVLQAGGPGLTLSPGLVTLVSPCSLSPGLVAPPAVASDCPRWQQDLAGDDSVAKVTGSTHLLTGTVARVRHSAVAPGVAEEVTHGQVIKDKVVRDKMARDEATPRGDRTGPPLGRAALGSLVTQLQALGAAILGDDGDIGDPP
ncbi:coiled-coil alpha-helical rod protein 1-like isoform X2 [Grus americana]|uniref:coiled-coil alpha-helical rod protein 1-like isoform X2 n=1 Tax=Grus americana TaxID=9117 RepID=UPI002408294E|nr:coiled-coil alpha-helical rod protein 1-like isoform X2 [Grus americana]XP_054667358.1 coiled-coil alpha-helical rod protein 1-like isoform X2 [Grus americana]XP_054667359.1 coiled-coil alpha-helical rod protein 1-like isoform X2 [Grus americana]